MSDKHLDDSLKQFIHVRIKELVEHSHHLATWEGKEKEKRNAEVSAIIAEISNNIGIFSQALRLAPHAREEANCQGMSTEELIERKAEMEALLRLYQQFQLEKKENKEKQMKTECIVTESQRQMNEPQPQKVEPGSSHLRLGLLWLQAICFLVAMVVIVCSLYKHFLR